MLSVSLGQTASSRYSSCFCTAGPLGSNGTARFFFTQGQWPLFLTNVAHTCERTRDRFRELIDGEVPLAHGHAGVSQSSWKPAGFTESFRFLLSDEWITQWFTLNCWLKFATCSHSFCPMRSGETGCIWCGFRHKMPTLPIFSLFFGDFLLFLVFPHGSMA